MKREKTPHSLREFESEVRKLKAVITFIIYGLLFLLLKTLYDRIIDLPEASTPFIITSLSFLLLLIVVLISILAIPSFAPGQAAPQRVQTEPTPADSLSAGQGEPA